MYVPRLHEMRMIQTQRAQQQATRETEMEVASILQQIERHRKHLPQEPDPSWLVREVVAHAQQSGVQFTSITPETPQQFEEFTRLAVSVQFNASYHQLGNFLDDVERSERFIRVERVEVNRSGNEDLASIQVTFSTLFLPPVLPAPAST
jgi:Tfp pilus assembly protein PilO